MMTHFLEKDSLLVSPLLPLPLPHRSEILPDCLLQRWRTIEPSTPIPPSLPIDSSRYQISNKSRFKQCSSSSDASITKSDTSTRLFVSVRVSKSAVPKITPPIVSPNTCFDISTEIGSVSQKSHILSNWVALNEMLPAS
ncbi:hypothetical protein BLNAU_18479 [Blattamonas nauphoetae]|uniref:Uncharacterized protein n=1 Tax=Blattamonas nauphoetae TaxID=2049346 RepID=A0ABQ9X465_9EUKA|nr:hypothetical protein BLNAU_18479 [Blattamonas nauphoetae]